MKYEEVVSAFFCLRGVRAFGDQGHLETIDFKIQHEHMSPDS